MSNIAVAAAVVVALVAGWGSASWLSLRTARARRALDETGGELRKLHVVPTPRVGGLALVFGIAAGTAAYWEFGGEIGLWLLLLLCVSPGFVWGLIEDLSKRGAVLVRLALTAMCAAAAYVLLDARITVLDVPVLDGLLTFTVVSFAFTLLAVAGVSHGVNIVDGLNGLSSMTALLAAIGLAAVAWAVGDTFLFFAACIVAASIGGFLVVNYPSGRIFLGDGGAYLVGLLLAEISVLLVHRNSEVSPWFPLVLLAYPIWETLFSMYRRKRRGQSTGHADALHLHSLVYRRIVRWKSFRAQPADHAARNSLASLVMWPMSVVGLAIGLLLWDRSLALQSAALAFAVFYVLVYRFIARFRVPRWMVLRATPRAASSRWEALELGERSGESENT
jgi:UDP-N-acetylmuramyl pentapeptide phosphotransferase/UDP-N-acetylglucosamine-1-phosphate transferase